MPIGPSGCSPASVLEQHGSVLSNALHVHSTRLVLFGVTFVRIATEELNGKHGVNEYAG